MGFGIRAWTHKIAIGDSDLIKSALAHFADSIGHLPRSEKCRKNPSEKARETRKKPQCTASDTRQHRESTATDRNKTHGAIQSKRPHWRARQNPWRSPDALIMCFC